MFNWRVLIKVDRFEEDAKKKFPKKLKPLPPQGMDIFEEKKLYITYVERPVQKSSYVYLSLIVISIVAFCCIAIWPLWLKLFVWWTLFILLCSIVNKLFTAVF